MDAINPVAASRHHVYRRRRGARASLPASRLVIASLGWALWPSLAAGDPAQGVTILPAPPETASRRVVVETTERSAWLERNEPAFIDGRWRLVWRPMCASPCTIDVPDIGLYRVSGPGIRSSQGFQMPPEPSTTYVRASPGSSTGWTLGLLGTIVGGPGILAGTVMLSTHPSCNEMDPECKASHTRGGVTALVLGVLLAGGGVYLLLSNKTDLSLTTTPPPAASARSFLGLTFSREGLVF